MVLNQSMQERGNNNDDPLSLEAVKSVLLEAWARPLAPQTEIENFRWVGVGGGLLGVLGDVNLWVWVSNFWV